MSRRRFNVFRDGYIHVMGRQCDSCIFRRDSVISRETVEGMFHAAIGDQSAIVCHHTIGTKTNAVCRGFYNRDRTVPLLVADAMGLVRFEDPA
jgi:hypothetical protein